MTSATTTIAEVRAVVNNYIKGSLEGDVELLRSIFHSQSVMMGYLGEDLMEGTPEPFFKMVEGAPSLQASGADYQAEIVEVRVTGNSATAILVEDGFFGMSFTDCFHLLKIEGNWLITSKLFHRH